MKNITPWLLFCVLTASGHAVAQNTQQTPGAASTTPSLVIAPTEMTQAEVRKVDVAAGKLTLKHGEIKNLDMPPMTMVFQVKDRAFLTQVKAGDQVKFTADKIKGAYTVLSIEVIQ